MNEQIREQAGILHTAALDRYVLALGDEYQAVVVGRTRRHTQLLRWNALALLGSPYHQVNHLELSKNETAWLLSLNAESRTMIVKRQAQTALNRGRHKLFKT